MNREYRPESQEGVLVSRVPDGPVPGPCLHLLTLDEVAALPPQCRFLSCDLGEALSGLQLQGVHSSSAHLAKSLADVGGAAPAARVGRAWASLRGSLGKSTECTANTFLK